MVLLALNYYLMNSVHINTLNIESQVGKWGTSADGVQKFFVSRSAIGYDIVPSYQVCSCICLLFVTISVIVLESRSIYFMQAPPDYTNLVIMAFFAITVAVLIRFISKTFPTLFYNPMFFFVFAMVCLCSTTYIIFFIFT